MCARGRNRGVPAWRQVARHPPALVRVDHDLERGADRPPHLLDHLDVLAPALGPKPELDGTHSALPQLEDTAGPLVRRDELTGRRICEQALGASAQQAPERQPERLADEIPDCDLDRPWPAAMEIHRLAELADHLGPERVDAREDALELGGVRERVPARVPRQPLVRPYGHERRLDLLARHRIPGRPERRVEREGIAPCLDGRDLHEPPPHASTVSGTAVRLLMPPPGPEAPAGGAARRWGCGSA